MPSIQKSFTRYIVYYFSGGAPGTVPQEAEIDCFDEAGARVGVLFFYPDAAPRPANENTISGIYLHFPLSRFADIVSLLKDEKPLHLNVDTVSKVGYIATGLESTGEQEGV